MIQLMDLNVDKTYMKKLLILAILLLVLVSSLRAKFIPNSQTNKITLLPIVNSFSKTKFKNQHMPELLEKMVWMFES